MSNLNYVLSKSTYVRGIRCLKSLYLNKHNPGLRDKVNELTQFKFDKGKEVGILAQKLFPDGVDCGIDVTGEVGKSIVLTGENIKKGLKTIYEAAFICNEVVAIADIITKNGGEWNVYEVKSSTEIKDYHYNDAAVQYYVLKNSGLKIKDISLVFLDNTYVRTGELEIAELFKIQSVKDEVIAI
ncbi:MAG: Dna2/Cas4 domain-containing protein, partial [Ignavibacteria bacterium]|nr:Dna2/Cas4 domain-containing protein [Ignavibacteria bacterium]